ncbi:hypothetical protein E2C01_095736 [Portunus trituberculatus]|uniref:Uncharacterized protein n=1 Tax=Portunus trituberculatus TaxID=210409 RepID=A0A5B7K6I7_PORTR|nr:hypothetical protein [Portunus trituberculatus]
MKAPTASFILPFTLPRARPFLWTAGEIRHNLSPVRCCVSKGHGGKRKKTGKSDTLVRPEEAEILVTVVVVVEVEAARGIYQPRGDRDRVYVYTARLQWGRCSSSVATCMRQSPTQPHGTAGRREAVSTSIGYDFYVTPWRTLIRKRRETVTA